MLCLVTDLQDFEQHNSSLVAAILFLMYKNNTCLLYLIVGCAAKYSCTIQEPSKFRFHASLITSIMPELNCTTFYGKSLGVGHIPFQILAESTQPSRLQSSS